MAGENKGSLPDWVNVVLAGLVLAGSFVGGWKVMGESITEVKAEMNAAKLRITNNEDYDGYLNDKYDVLKERVIRNETNIDNITSSLSNMAISLRSIANDIKETNENLNKFIIEQAKTNGSNEAKNIKDNG